MATGPGDRVPDDGGPVEAGHVPGVRGDGAAHRPGGQPIDPELIDTGIVDWVFDTSRDDLDGLTIADRHRFARILLNPCPTCDAKPGQRCVRRGSGEEILRMDDQHQPRRYAITGRPPPESDIGGS